AFDGEHTDGLRVDPALRPGQDFEGPLEGAETAGQRDEPVGQLGHRRLALVHRADHPQLREPGVSKLACGERPRDHADHLAALGEDGVGKDAHEAYRPAAVDEPEPARGERAAEPLRRIAVGWTRTQRRAAEDADPPHPPSAPIPRATPRTRRRASRGTPPPPAPPGGPTSPAAPRSQARRPAYAHGRARGRTEIGRASWRERG